MLTVLLEFQTLNPPMMYRGIRSSVDNPSPLVGYRLEKKGLSAKKFKPFMWTNSVDDLMTHVKVIHRLRGCKDFKATIE